MLTTDVNLDAIYDRLFRMEALLKVITSFDSCSASLSCHDEVMTLQYVLLDTVHDIQAEFDGPQKESH